MASNGVSADDDADEVDDGLAEDDEEDGDEDEDDDDVDEDDVEALLLPPPHALSSATKTMNDAQHRAWVRKGGSVSE
jgi:hypothetical protein